MHIHLKSFFCLGMHVSDFCVWSGTTCFICHFSSLALCVVNQGVTGFSSACQRGSGPSFHCALFNSLIYNRELLMFINFSLGTVCRGT